MFLAMDSSDLTADISDADLNVFVIMVLSGFDCEYFTKMGKTLDKNKKNGLKTNVFSIHR